MHIEVESYRKPSILTHPYQQKVLTSLNPNTRKKYQFQSKFGHTTKEIQDLKDKIEEIIQA